VHELPGPVYYYTFMILYRQYTQLHTLICYCCGRIFFTVFQHTVRGNTKVVSNQKNLLDIYNIGHVQKSMFGPFVDNVKFFYQQKNQQYKYVYDQVGVFVSACTFVSALIGIGSG